ncbi:MAG: haloacid dehalogenase [Chloroflexi bacterium]|nr:haloacid dehalogenase [Chloroflexota bacterium]
MKDIAESALTRLEAKNQAREEALQKSRRLTRLSADTIRAVHRGELEEAQGLLVQGRDLAARLRADLTPHPDLFYTGYAQDAMKEFAEANLTYAFITNGRPPRPDELGVEIPAYLNGLGEAAGELRRHVLDLIREGKVERGEAILGVMDDIYSVLVSIDYPDALTGGLRRTTDMVRGVLEKTRGDLTIALRQNQLEQALKQIQDQQEKKT